MAASTEERELKLVNNVENKFVLANSDNQLESQLRTYLAPLLLKLASDNVNVRNKVISICQHVNTRAKPETVQLPVLALVQKFKENPQSPLIRHFTRLFIHQGLPRLSSPQAAELFPALASGIASDLNTSAPNTADRFNFLLRCLSCVKFPPKGSPEDKDLCSQFDLNTEDIKLLSFWFGKVLQLRPGNHAACPSLSADQYAFLTLQGKPEIWDPSKPGGLNAIETRITVVKALSSGLFTDQERLLPALFASADPNTRLSSVGDELLKRALPNVSAEETSFLDELYQTYFGGHDDLSSTSVNSPAVIPVRIKILNILAKSSASTTYPARIIQIVEQDLYRNLANDEVSTKPGREVFKLRSAVIAFLTHVARRATKSDLEEISKAVVRTLKDLLDQQFEDPRSMEVRNVRGRSFEVIGLLANANGQILVEDDLSLLRWLFRSLGEEQDKEIVFSIDEALSASIRPFQQEVPLDALNMLKELLLSNMGNTYYQNSRNVRFATLRFANRCLSFHDVTARWIDIYAFGEASEDDHEIIEEARKGLDPYWHQLLNDLDKEKVSTTSMSSQHKSAFPAFAEISSYVFPRSFDHPKTTPLAVSYVRKALLYESLASQDIATDMSLDWERKLDLQVSQESRSREAVRNYIATKKDDEEFVQGLQSLWTSASNCMTTNNAKERIACGRIYLDLCILSPSFISEQMAKDFRALEPIVITNNIELRNLAAQAYGLLASQSPLGSGTVQNSVDAMLLIAQGWKSAIGAEVNKAHGALIALAFFASRKFHRTGGNQDVSDLMQKLLPLIIDIFEHSTDIVLQEGSYFALGQLCLFLSINPEDISKHAEVKTLIEKLSKKAKAGNERAVAALGHMSIVMDEDKHSELISQIIDEVHALHEIRQPETQFAVGEALSCITCAWDCSALVPLCDMEGPFPKGPRREKTASTLVEKVLTNSKTTKPALKKASVIWLLCFIQFCGTRVEIQNRLPQFQLAFKRCLSDRDELVQESASRGLGLVYEKGSRDLKDELVKDLVGSFSGEKQSNEISGTVDEDTQLFEPGALPTGDGSVTTYKDILSLASEVGDSSLVYRFMSLASNNAIWSSRAAFGRFGLSNVLSDSSVDGYLASNPKLYPKLYRYRFDPNTNVRRSMNDIWTALVRDSGATIEKHFSSIIEDLLANIVGKEWRVRQACCAAVGDLIQGRRLEKIQPYLDQIWSLCFKVLDDIKDSVRKAASELARVLTGILIRSLETSEGKAAATENMLKSVLPFLLSTSGLESSAKDVREFSLHTLLDIIKKGRDRTIRPFVPELIERLLGLLSTFEPEAINYIQMNAANYNLKNQDIDDLRLQSIRSSPLMEAIERCIDHLDADTMKDLTPRLQNAMKVAVGVPTKVGCSRTLVSLSTRRNIIFQPYADLLLRTVEKRLTDRNETVSSSYAACMGYMSRGASDTQILALASFAQTSFFNADDDRQRIIAGEIVHSVARFATDRFNALASAFLPFVFIAQRVDDEAVARAFKETWDENVAGPRAVALYLPEIVRLASAYLTSKHWTLKHAAALAISDAILAIAKQDAIKPTDATLLWPPLVTALAEKTWDGKSALLPSFVALVQKAPAPWLATSEISAEITKIALREAKRRNPSYQQDALPCLAQIIAARDVDMYEPVSTLVRDVIEELTAVDDDAMDVDVEAGKDPERIRARRLAGAVECLFAVVTPKAETSAAVPTSLSDRTKDVLVSLARVASERARDVQSALFTSATLFLRALGDTAASVLGGKDVGGQNRAAMADLLLAEKISIGMPEGVRLAQTEAIGAFAEVLTRVELDEEEEAVMRQRIVKLSDGEKGLAVRAALEKAANKL